MDKRLLFACFIFSFLFSTGYAQTNVSGVLTSNTTWTKAQSPYNLTGDVVVPLGLKLTIEAGVSIERKNESQILVNGNIVANGSKSDSITFKNVTSQNSYSSFFLDFQKSNLSASNLSFITFKGNSSAVNNIRVGNETLFSSGNVRNTGSLMVSNSNLSRSYVITKGFRSGASLDIKDCLAIGSIFTSSSTDAEVINISNSQIFNSSITNDSQTGGISLTKVYLRACNFSIGCCDAGMNFKNCRVDNSFILNSPNIGTYATGKVNLLNTIIINTPIQTVYNAYNIKNSKIIATRNLLTNSGGTLLHMIDIGPVVVENSEIASIKDANNNGIYTRNNPSNLSSAVTTLNNNLFKGLLSSITVSNTSDFQVNNNNFYNVKYYAIKNFLSTKVSAENNFYELKLGQQLGEMLSDGDTQKGKITYLPKLDLPSTSAPVSAPENVVKNFANGVLNVSWFKNSAANVKGYKVYWGYVDGFTYEHSAELKVTDSTYTIGNVSNSESVAVTAITTNADGVDDQTDGSESWFATAELPSPVISSFFPKTAGINHKVTIDGYNLNSVSSVSFGGVPAADFTIISSTRIVATVGNAKSGNVSVSNNLGTYDKDGFAFRQPPTITSIKPVPATVGQKIGIIGKDLWDATIVSINGVRATPITVLSPNLIIATVPNGAKSDVLSVTTTFGTSTSNNFEYMDAPQISYQIPTKLEAGAAIASISPENKGGATSASNYGNTTTLAGNGQAMSTDGNGTLASFYNPIGVAADEQGNLYVTEQSSHTIRMVTPSGIVTTLAGGGSGYTDGTVAKFNTPSGITVGQDGNIYVADQGNNCIRKILRDGTVSTLAGSRTAGALNGTKTLASFNQPIGITSGPDGTLYVADQLNNLIRKVTLDGVVTTFAGNGNQATVDGMGNAVSFNRPAGIVVDADGNVFVSESVGNVIRKVTASGTATTIAGSGRSAYNNGKGNQAGFSQPFGLTIDKAGMLYVADRSTNTIRIISPQGDVNTLAGSWTGNSGSTNGIANNALFSQPTGVAYASGKLYVADLGNRLIRSIDVTGYNIFPSLPAGLMFNNQTGTISGVPTASLPPTNYTITAANTVGADTVSIRLAIALPQAPNITYNKTISAALNTPIKPITPTNTGGAVMYTTSNGVFTGAGSGSGFADGKAAMAQFSGATGLAMDEAGNMYVADVNNNRIRKVSSDGTVSTLAGSGSNGGNNAIGSLASFAKPSGVAVDVAGNIYVADASNYKIRKITPAGVVTTYAGNGTASSIDGTSTSSSFRDPRCIAIDGKGIVYVTESSAGCVRKIDQNGTVSTIATGLGAPLGIAVDAAGNLFVAESSFNQISKITPSGTKSIFVTGVNSDPLLKFTSPKGISIDPAGNLYVIDQSNYVVRKVSSEGIVSSIPGFNPAASPVTSFFANGITYADGKLYISEDSRIRIVDLYGYRISPTLPMGLNIDAATGVISGSPISTVTNAEYMVTATNPGGMSSTKLNLNVVNEPAPDISYIAVSPFKLNKTITPLIPQNSGGAVSNVNSVLAAYAGTTTSFGYLDGPKADAKFNSPNGIVADNKGNLFIAERNNNRIRKITTDGNVSTLAGSGASMFTDGLGTGASFNTPFDIVCDKAGNVFVSDVGNYRIRKISPDGRVITFAGNGAPSSVDGTGTNASFAEPRFMTIDANDNLYVIDYSSGKIRKVSPAGIVTTIASGFNTPRGITADALGNVYVSNVSASPIKKIAPDGQISDFVTANAADPLNSISFAYAMTIDPAGNLYVLDSYTYLVKKVSSSGVVSQLPGLNYTPSPSGVIYALGITYNSGKLYLTDNTMIRQITLNGYHVEPQLPAGLSIDKVSGVISGTPTLLSSAKDFTITAVNFNGASSTKVTLAVDGDNGLNFAPFQPATYGDPAVTINITSSNTSLPINYTSSNLNVAAIVNGKLNIIGAGSAIITAKQTGMADVEQTLTVNPKAISITAINVDKIYADTDPAFKYALSSNAIVGSDVLTGALNRDAGENTGIYKINQGTLTAGKNYTITYVSAMLTINKKTLTVTAEDKARMQGKNNPEFTVIYDGFANGDNSGKLSTQPVVTTTASLASPTGIYDLVPGNGSADNYIFIYRNGKLTVNAATNNFKVAAVNVSCKGQNNGSINITPGVSASYTAVLTGNNVNRSAPFTSGTTFDNLAPGAYNVCITDAALPGRPQCFDIVISEPKDLSVYASTDKASGLLTLALAGGSNYNVTLNGTVYKTSSSSISVPLQSGSNKVTVTTDQPCQGTFEECYVQTDKQLPYPNPFQEVIYVNLGEDIIGKVIIKLYDVSSGALKLNQQFTAQSGVVRLDAAQLGMGVYSMHLSMDGKEKVYKLIKK